MKRMRKVHLWIGLVTSILLFLEAGTGLLLMEPWLVGAKSQEHRLEVGERGAFNGGEIERPAQSESSQSRQNGGVQRIPGSGERPELAQGQFNIMRMIRGLHEGRIGNVDITWLIDLSAVSIIILTGTGIYLSVKILRTENRKKA